jgi:hypothetical protein
MTKSDLLVGPEGCYRSFLEALWELISAGCCDAPAEVISAAAACCVESAAQVLAGDSHLIVQARSGAIFVNSVRIRPAVASFAACTELAERMEAAGMAELLCMPTPDIEEWSKLARAWRQAGCARAIEAALAQDADRRIHCGASEALASR